MFYIYEEGSNHVEAGMSKPTLIICLCLTFIHIPASQTLKNKEAKCYIRRLNSLWKQGKVRHIWDQQSPLL